MLNTKKSIFGALAVALAVSATGAVLQTRGTSAHPGKTTGLLAANNDAARGLSGLFSTPPDAPKPGEPAVKAVRTVNPEDEKKVAAFTVQLLEGQHFLHRRFDDTLSSELLDEYLDALDPQHIYFLQSDIADFNKYRTTLDDATRSGDLTPADKIFARFMQRVQEQEAYVTGALTGQKFEFTGDDAFTLDRKKAERPATTADASKLWQTRLRYEYLQEKLAKTKPEEISKKLNRRYTRLVRSLKEYDNDDIMELYLTTLTHVYDPHSDYFGPSTSENFGIQLKLSLFGIGAQLQSEDGYTKIMELTPGGPALRSGLLKPGDRIVAVAQGKDGEPVDVVDMKIDRVVDLIRGPKGTTVRLTILPAGASDPSTRKVIALERDEVKLDEQAAKARIIESPATTPGGKPERVGVIDLPSFYGDTDNNKSATADVAALLKKLKEANVDGVILDLRRNGGGSLPEAISLAGLFIKQGPVVQVKDPDGDIKVDSDEDAGVTYDGPLVVLTSRFSASASEIVAGALQDHGRAVLVGDASTFGKGTVQALLPLAQIMERIGGARTEGDPGTLKITVQKFYRPSGSSTQLKGVVPDVILPSLTDALDTGEKSLDHPLRWDTVKSAPYTRDNRVLPFLPELKKRSASRIATDKDFVYLRAQIAEAKKAVDQKVVSLNEQKRQTERKEAEERTKARRKELAARSDNKEKIYTITLKDAMRPGLPVPMTASQLAKAERAKRPARAEDPDTTLDDADNDTTPERDILLDEAGRVLVDYANLTKRSVPATARR